MAFVQALTSPTSNSTETTKASGEKVFVSALKKSLPATSLKLQTTLKRNANGNDQKRHYAAEPNAHIKSIVANVTTYNKDTASVDTRTELEQHGGIRFRRFHFRINWQVLQTF